MKTKMKPKSVRVSVTRKDIAHGKPGEPRACPVFLAIKRTIGRPVPVYSDSVGIGEKLVALPKKIRDWIEDFDTSVRPQNMRPIKFTLKISGHGGSGK